MPRNVPRSLRRLYSARTIREAEKTAAQRRSRRFWAPEGLEDRVMLLATVYTDKAITDSGAGSGTSGDLMYCIN